MNKILYSILSYTIAIIFLFAACTPDKYDLGTVDVTPDKLVEGIAFSITKDASNPNIVYLENKMDTKYTPLWIHPQGYSQAQKVTLKIPFEGTYNVTFGVMTHNGIVYGDPAEFIINDFYAGFVEDELWALLSGGVNNEKTWYLDLDADGVSRYFAGPLFFYGSDDWWGNISGNDPALGDDSWNWNPDYPGNSWLMSAGNYGSMTFNLKNGANVTTEHLMASSRGKETGTYMLDTDNKTLTLTNASILHDAGRDNQAIGDWRNCRIVSLTENTLQLGVLRNPETSGEDICLLVYNFISKDYFDNWTPGEEIEPEPTLPDGWKDDVSQTVTTAIKWILSPETPFNWSNLDGSLMNNWLTPADYPDWTGFNASVSASYAKFSLVMDSKNNKVIYTSSNESVTEGTYTLDDKGIYTFTGIKPYLNICSDRYLETSDDNSWRIVKIDKDFSGKVSGMWVGVRDAVKPEYFVYYLIPEGISSDDDGSQGTAITFNPSKIPFGDFEGNGNLRIEIFNAYGSTNADPGIKPSDVVFNNGISVTFTLSGINWKADAAGTYNASVFFANTDWWPSGNGSNVTVAGDGTYTATFLGTSSQDALVFVIDIVGIHADIEDMNNVKVTVDKIIAN
ncbi:MAG: hypothetical protein LBL79_01100 [Prevotella sp.]|jgi:hypothetical protein|nr:hypothetical protein [Prevotella sp.]